MWPHQWNHNWYIYIYIELWMLYELEIHTVAVARNVFLIYIYSLLRHLWNIFPPDLLTFLFRKNKKHHLFASWWFQLFFLFLSLLREKIQFDFRIFFKFVVQPPPFVGDLRNRWPKETCKRNWRWNWKVGEIILEGDSKKGGSGNSEVV